MKKRRKRTAFPLIVPGLLALGLSLLFSCSDSLPTGSPQDEKGLARFSLSPVAMNGEATRSTGAGTVGEDRVACLHILEYQEGILTDQAFVDQLSDTVFDVRLTRGTANLYFVANVPSGAFDAAPADETAFLSAVRNISSESGVLYIPATGLQCLPMSGMLTGVTLGDTGYPDTQQVVLTRMAARIELNCSLVESARDTLSLQQLRVCNVPNRLSYTSPTGNYPVSPTGAEFLSTAYEAVDNNGGSFTFYLPENLRGVGTNETTDERYKTGVEYATYVELSGVTASGWGFTYRIYPGADAYNDYNLKRNTVYRMNLTVAGISKSDARISLSAP
ncbi:MAG: DUF4906 domain-containing protein [Bacteroides sp.]|jgi:hypothetical protein|nr:DUF4906 domain-containing protein [Bacteroides sp.]